MRSPSRVLGPVLVVAALLAAWVVLRGPDATPPELTEAGPDEFAAPPSADSDPASGRRRADSAPPTDAEAPAGNPTSAPVPSAAPRARFRLVRAQDGLPLPAVRVRARPHDASPAREWVTDQEGRFALPAAEAERLWRLDLPGAAWELATLAPALVSDRAEWGAGERTVRVQTPAHALEVEVYAPTGSLVADATIQLHGSAAGDGPAMLRRSTDETGRLRLAWPPPASGAAGWTAQATHPEHGASPVVALPDELPAPPVALHLQAGATLRLRVVDATRTPFPHRKVNLRGLHQSEQLHVAQFRSAEHLDAHGERVWRNLLPGPYKILLVSPVGRGWLERQVELEPGDHELTWVIDDPAEKIGVSGRLVLADGSPVVDQFVMGYRVPGSALAGMRTDADGRFVLFGERRKAERVRLHTNEMEDASARFGADGMHMVAWGEQDVVLVGELIERQSVAVRVHDREGGGPVARAGIWLLPFQGGFEQRLGTTNADGLALIELDPEHPSIDLGIRAPGYSRGRASWRPGRGVVEEGLTRLTTVHLQCLEARSYQPIEGAEVLSADGSRVLATTGSVGWFELPADPALRFVLRHPEYQDSAPLDLRPDLIGPVTQYGKRMLFLEPK